MLPVRVWWIPIVEGSTFHYSATVNVKYIRPVWAFDLLEMADEGKERYKVGETFQNTSEPKIVCAKGKKRRWGNGFVVVHVRE